MIRNETEYRHALKSRDEQAARLLAQRAALAASGLAPAELDRGMAPMVTFHQQLIEEIDLYEALRRDGPSAVQRLPTVGLQLVGLRIAQSLSQRELAERLGVHESQVSRDERNEYHGITVERVTRILTALGLEMTAHYTPTRPALLPS
jgi:predicted XRE-type DNA-binding protein